MIRKKTMSNKSELRIQQQHSRQSDVAIMTPVTRQFYRLCHHTTYCITSSSGTWISKYCTLSDVRI